MNKEELYNELAEAIFPDITEKIEDLESRYPKRNLKEGAEVTRTAPSPTGFLHIGTVFGAILDARLAKQTDGVFYLRIEDTDTKREVEGSAKDIITQLREYGVVPNEGPISETDEIGAYGPYKQSQRENIYKICAKELIRKGRAYPCFCTAEDLNTLRTTQEKNKQIPGYYGIYARCRNNSVETMIERVKNGEPYILRFRSLGSHLNKISFKDSIRGKIEMAQNDQDIVLIKSDGLPTYHFAHAVDDHFMRTTTVVRGEEWIPSVALHLELFDALGFEQVKYAHTPTIMKLDNGSKRKLSKRKDPESAVSFFLSNGYPADTLVEYVLNLLNSDFEIWRRQNPTLSHEDFEVRLNKINNAGALFDIVKLNDISKDVIARMDSKTLLEKVLDWAKDNDEKTYNYFSEDFEYARRILAIERDNAAKIRKDFAKYNDILSNFFYFYDDLFEEDIKSGMNFDYKDGKISIDYIKEVITEYINVYDINDDKDTWFAKVKVLTDKLGYCSNMKEYKQNPDSYKGSVADVTGMIRVALTNRKNTPDIYELSKVMGIDRVNKRLNNVIEM